MGDVLATLDEWRKRFARRGKRAIRNARHVQNVQTLLGRSMHAIEHLQARLRRLRDRPDGDDLSEWIGNIGVCAKCTLPSERGGDPMRVCGRHADLLADICDRLHRSPEEGVRKYDRPGLLGPLAQHLVGGGEAGEIVERMKERRERDAERYENLERDGEYTGPTPAFTRLERALERFDSGPQGLIPDTSNLGLPEPLTWGDLRHLLNRLRRRSAAPEPVGRVEVRVGAWEGPVKVEVPVEEVESTREDAVGGTQHLVRCCGERFWIRDDDLIRSDADEGADEAERRSER